jgi:hypothetical protein
MKLARCIPVLLILAFIIPSCQKNTVSKIPQIGLITVYPDTAMKVNIDTCYMEFSLVDGDADLGYSNSAGPGDTISSIYLKDSRYESVGFVRVPFPGIDVSIEDPKKGIEGKCLFYPLPQPVPRDSAHAASGDTLYYQFYIKDRAGNMSNVVTTHPFRIHL